MSEFVTRTFPACLRSFRIPGASRRIYCSKECGQREKGEKS